MKELKSIIRKPVYCDVNFRIGLSTGPCRHCPDVRSMPILSAAIILARVRNGQVYLLIAPGSTKKLSGKLPI